jgi:hypothetical protein
MGISGLVCVAVVIGAIFGIVWLVRRKPSQPNGSSAGGFDAGMRKAISSGVDDAFEQHRRKKQEGGGSEDKM